MVCILGSPLLAAATDEAPQYPPSGRDFENAIALLDAIDPHAPAALAGRLEYANFLAGSADGRAADGDCRQRLERAESLLSGVAADPALGVTLPVGRARAANIEYRIHLARASCGSGPLERERELRAAEAASERAVGGYRDALDYRSMAIAQYDLAVAQHLLGEVGIAIASLETAIEMDREFGLRQDAEENDSLLMRWQDGDAASAAAAGGTLREFPTRTVTLKFGWMASQADVTTRLDYVRAAGGIVERASGSAVSKRRVRALHGRWAASYEPTVIADDAAVPPQSAAQFEKLAILFTRALCEHADLVVGADGDLQTVEGSYRLSRRLSVEATELLVRRSTHSGEGTAGSPSKIAHDIELAFAPALVETAAADEYSLQTGAWIGATLEQGAWYTMSASLRLPGLEQIRLAHDVEFAYTRNVPCGADTDGSCVELVIHATPQQGEVKDLLEQLTRRLHLPNGQTLHYWSATYLRLVTDPATLMVHTSDMRRYWYLSSGHGAADDDQNVAERVVSTYTYVRDKSSQGSVRPDPTAKQSAVPAPARS